MARPYLTPDEYWRDPGSFWIHRDPITGYPTMNSQNQFVYGRSEYPQAWVSETDFASPGTPAPPFAEPTPIPDTSYAPPSGAGYGAGFDQTYPEGLVGSTVDMPGTPVDPFAQPTPIPEMPGFGSGYINAGGGFDPQANVGGTDIANFGQNAVPYFPPPVAAGNYGVSQNYDPVNMGTIGFPPGSGLLNPFQEYSIGGSLPTDFSSLGIPGSNSPGPGSLSPIGGNPMSFGTSVTPDWGSLPSSNDYGWSAPDYSSVTQNVGGPMDLSGYGGMIGGGFDLSGGGIDFGYLPSSNDYGWTAPDYSSSVATQAFAPPEIPQDFSQSPADVFAGLQDPVPAFTEPGPLTSDIPVPAGISDLTPPPDIPDVPPDAPVTPDGTQTPTSGTDSGSGGGDSGTSTTVPISNLGTGFTGGFGVGAGPGLGVTPAGFSVGYTPFGGGGVGPQFSSGNNSNLFGGLVALPGGGYVQTGMFGLGAMNAPGGSFSLGMGGPESGISIRTQGDSPDFAFGKAANEAAKLGMSVDDYMAMVDSTTTGPTKFQTNALADPYKFWESRILQSRRMAAAGSGSQPSGPIGIDPTYSIDAARNAGMYKGWTFDPTAGTFVPPTTSTAKPSKGANK